MTNGRDPNSRETLRAVAMVSQLGFAAGMPVIICALGGYFLEERYPASGLWVIGGVGLGLAAGIVAAYRVLSPFLSDDNDKK